MGRARAQSPHGRSGPGIIPADADAGRLLRAGGCRLVASGKYRSSPLRPSLEAAHRENKLLRVSDIRPYLSPFSLPFRECAGSRSRAKIRSRRRLEAMGSSVPRIIALRFQSSNKVSWAFALPAAQHWLGARGTRPRAARARAALMHSRDDGKWTNSRRMRRAGICAGAVGDRLMINRISSRALRLCHQLDEPAELTFFSMRSRLRIHCHRRPALLPGPSRRASRLGIFSAAYGALCIVRSRDRLANSK